MSRRSRTSSEGFSRRTDLPITFEVQGDLNSSGPATDGAIYRVVQEALSNVHRHARAHHASVQLVAGRTMTHVVIADDGLGMPIHVCAGVGLSGMRSRLSELGGRLSVYSRSPGTAVIGSVPAQNRINHGGDLLLPYHAHDQSDALAV